MIPRNWEEDLIIGTDDASACAILVEHTTRFLIIEALTLGRKADQVCNALTRRIQGLAKGAIQTLTRGSLAGKGPPPAPHPRLWRKGPLRSPPQPLGPWNRRKHQPAHPRRPTQRNPYHQPSALPRRLRLRTEQLSQSHPRLSPPQKHLTNTLLTPIDTAHFTILLPSFRKQSPVTGRLGASRSGFFFRVRRLGGHDVLRASTLTQ